MSVAVEHSVTCTRTVAGTVGTALSREGTFSSGDLLCLMRLQSGPLVAWECVYNGAGSVKYIPSLYVL